MPFITKNAAQIRTDMLRDIKNLLQLPDDKLGQTATGMYGHRVWPALPKVCISIRDG